MKTALNDATQPKGKKLPLMPRKSVHRGITMDEMPMRAQWKRRWAWAMFCRDLWPPQHWRIPETLEGQPLAVMLEERCQSFNSKKGKDHE